MTIGENMQPHQERTEGEGNRKSAVSLMPGEDERRALVECSLA
jgi:hypothetical protein